MCAHTQARAAVRLFQMREVQQGRKDEDAGCPKRLDGQGNRLATGQRQPSIPIPNTRVPSEKRSIVCINSRETARNRARSIHDKQRKTFPRPAVVDNGHVLDKARRQASMFCFCHRCVESCRRKQVTNENRSRLYERILMNFG